MASPQTAHGYTKVANSIMRALFRFHFSGQELRLIIWALRDSYGWGQKATHAAPLWRIHEETGIPTSTASWVIRRLVKASVLSRDRGGAMRFNKNYDEWILEKPNLLPLFGRSSAAPVAAPEEEDPTRSKAFVPPTIEQVRAYCHERKNRVDADRFWHHYESNGWKTGKNPVTNWKSSVCFWERTERDGKTTRGPAGAICPICEIHPLPKNAVVCEKCGPRCRACNEQTADLKIVTRLDKTKTAVCRKGCNKRPSPIARAATPEATKQMDAERTARFLDAHNRRKGR